MLLSRTLEADALQNDAALRLCPGIYQACVGKRYDLRVTVIGRRVVDWRAASIGGTPPRGHSRCPARGKPRYKRLMESLGLVFGCIDLVADQHDELHFLEINQVGQFLFVEQDAPELPLLRATAAMLAEGRPDYSLDAIADDVSYASYAEDPEQIAWWESVAPGMRGKNGAIAGGVRTKAGVAFAGSDTRQRSVGLSARDLGGHIFVLDSVRMHQAHAAVFQLRSLETGRAQFGSPTLEAPAQCPIIGIVGRVVENQENTGFDEGLAVTGETFNPRWAVTDATGQWQAEQPRRESP